MVVQISRLRMLADNRIQWSCSDDDLPVERYGRGDASKIRDPLKTGDGVHATREVFTRPGGS